LFFGNSYKWFPDKTQTVGMRITHRSTGRQKQSRFLPVGKLLAKERSHFKRYSFFAFTACELSVIRQYNFIAHWQMSQSQASKYVTNS